ncbi:type II toxin-antitoxin system VapC family toxin [Scytonema sp. NUACC21]
MAPTLLCYEVTNVFYRMKLAKQLLDTEAQQCLNNALNLSIQFYGDLQLHQQAWELAQQFNLPAAYDAHYLALAQRFQADFYTGDKRLFNTVHSALPWIHLVE